MKTKNFPEKQNIRRIKVVERLAAQLKSGKKTKGNEELPLIDTDVSRIKNEISTLEKRITGDARNRRTKKYRGDLRNIYKS